MIKVMASSVISAPIDQVWKVVRDYNGLPNWSPAIVKSRIEDGGAADRISTVRALEFADGGKLREVLLALSDTEYSVTYAIIESELPITNYRSTIQLQPITDGDRTYITWSGEFDPIGDSAAEMKQQLEQNIYQAGFDALKQRFA